MIALLAALIAPASAAGTCADVEPVPEVVQVAWVSPLGRQVRGGQTLEVVRVADLQAYIKDESPDSARLVHALGMVGRRGRGADEAFKVTVFDVRTEWLCRPIDDAEPGAEIAGVAACASARPAKKHHRHGFTGCGYALDTAASVRGLDVYRITWDAAASGGFCVMPIERFLEGR